MHKAAAEQEPLLREAIDNQSLSGGRVVAMRLRPITFCGPHLLQEGETFRRRNLARSIAGVNKLKIMYPVKMRSIVHLDRRQRIIDLTFCFRERRLEAPRAATTNRSAFESYSKL